MEHTEQKHYEDLRALEKIKLRREFSGFSQYGILWNVILFLACGVVIASAVLFVIFSISPNRQRWYLSIMIIMHIATFVFYSMMLTMMSKQKKFFEALGSKKQIIVFFISLAISIIGNIFVIAYIFTKAQAWLYWPSITIPNLGLVIFLLLPIKTPSKYREEARKENENFFIWLEKEKNIIRKSTGWQDKELHP